MTAIDFTTEVEKRKDLLADLFSLLKLTPNVTTTRRTLSIHLDLVSKSLEKFLEIADRDGYPTTNVDNYAGHFEFGDGESSWNFAHMDVVPAGSGWD